MRATTLILLVVSVAVCTGCTTVRDFYGIAANLKGEGEQTPPGTHLKIGITCSGTAPNGDRYVAFSFRRRNCWLVLFHPPVEPTKSLRTETTSGHTGAWLVRGSKPDCTTLARRGAEAAFLADRAERLRGSIEILWRGTDDFYMPVELVGAAGETAVRGQFAAYTALWKPLVGPAMLLGFGGARAPRQ